MWPLPINICAIRFAAKNLFYKLLMEIWQIIVIIFLVKYS